MVSGLPCETLPELLQWVLLHFDSGDVAQAMTAKPRNQVLSQKKRINLARSKLECRQNSRLKALRSKLRQQHCALRTVLPLVNGVEVSVQKSSGFTAARDFADRPEHN